MESVALEPAAAGQFVVMAAEDRLRLRMRPAASAGEPSMSRPGERKLLREAQRGSEEALEVLVRRHWPLAHRAAYLVIGDATAAEDVAQEALVAAIRSLDRFDLRRPFGPWLHRIAVNRAIDHARARAARGEVASGTAEEAELRGDPRAPADGEPDPRAGRLRGALAGLSPEHRAIVAMRFLLDLSPGEIAAELDLPRGTVNSRLRRALDHLAADIGEER
jgi:RNA polymerase sigma-70 factor (ECF subfamily)